MMTRIISFLFAFLLYSVITGQVALLDKVYDYVDAKDYAKALEALKIAEQNSVTATDPKTYYLKSFIYKDLYNLSNETGAKDSLLNLALTSLNKSRSLDSNETFQTRLDELETFFFSGYYNLAVNQFNERNYEKALELFNLFTSKTNNKNPYWIDASYYMGVSYQMLNSTDDALLKYEMLANRDYGQPLLYYDLTNLYMQRGDESKTFEALDKGLTLFPNDPNLIVARLNALSYFGHYQELETRLEESLESDENNIELLIMLGSTYTKNTTDENKEVYFEKVETTYGKALALDTKNVDANFNLGVHYYNEAVEIINKNDYDISLQELSIILENSSLLFKKSLPYLQKIYENNKSLKILEAMRAIYYNLNMITELEKVTEEIAQFAQ